MPSSAPISLCDRPSRTESLKTSLLPAGRRSMADSNSPVSVDNTGESHVAPWLEAVKAIRPAEVMVYTIDRETPDRLLQKASHEELDAIRDRVRAAGIRCTASY